MKHYVIYLPRYVDSVNMAQHAVATGREHGWKIELFEGVDGQVLDLAELGLHINQDSAKCREMMQRPGVRGCFASHWSLWKICADTNQTVGIFEHDIEFLAPPPQEPFQDVLKLEGFYIKKAKPAGPWYEGARAYFLKPHAARKLLDWTLEHGALPADVQIGQNIVDIQLYDCNIVQQCHGARDKNLKRRDSFTWNLENQIELKD
jgi:GR25 family glycosyltransferase involved in LPS biosynthesis